jgi:hypothetical protein
MASLLIKPLRLEALTISELLECSTLLINNIFTPETAQMLGLGKPYDDLLEMHGKYASAIKRNPRLIDTMPLTKAVTRVRNLLAAFNKTLQAAKIIDDAGTREALELIINITAPYLKTRHRSTMAAVLADAGDMCEALQHIAVAPKVGALGLTAQVTAIKALTDWCNDLLYNRGKEVEYRRRTGSASKARAALQRQYRLIFRAIVPGIYLLATNTAVKDKLIELINHTNATLIVFRHLVGSKGSAAATPPAAVETRPEQLSGNLASVAVNEETEKEQERAAPLQEREAKVHRARAPLKRRAARLLKKYGVRRPPMAARRPV